MNQDLLDNCRVCGQIISKNLVGDCPHCGEPKPHLTEEEIEIRREEQEREEEEKRKEIKTKNAEEAKILKSGCLIFLAVLVFLFFVSRACIHDYDEKYLEEIERIKTEQNLR